MWEELYIIYNLRTVAMLLPAYCHEDKHKSPVSLHVIALVIIDIFKCSVTKATRACAVMPVRHNSTEFLVLQ